MLSGVIAAPRTAALMVRIGFLGDSWYEHSLVMWNNAAKFFCSDMSRANALNRVVPLSPKPGRNRSNKVPQHY